MSTSALRPTCRPAHRSQEPPARHRIRTGLSHYFFIVPFLPLLNLLLYCTFCFCTPPNASIHRNHSLPRRHSGCQKLAFAQADLDYPSGSERAGIAFYPSTATCEGTTRQEKLSGVDSKVVLGSLAAVVRGTGSLERLLETKNRDRNCSTRAHTPPERLFSTAVP